MRFPMKKLFFFVSLALILSWVLALGVIGFITEWPVSRSNLFFGLAVGSIAGGIELLLVGAIKLFVKEPSFKFLLGAIAFCSVLFTIGLYVTLQAWASI